MWLKAFQSGDKLLSESEFWFLTVVKDEFEAPTEIMDRLYQQTMNWTPKSGTVYPALHRLADVGLLDKNEDNGLKFRRSEHARIFLSSIAKPLRVQLLETCNYYQVIIENLHGLEFVPARFPEVLDEMSMETAKFMRTLKKLAIASKIKQEELEKSYDVEITFED